MHGYTRIRKIGTGGQGDVWIGSSESGDQVAMKYLRKDADAQQHAENLRRFEHEVKMHTTLSHPGIMPILFADLSDGDTPYFVMPFAATGSLERRLRPGEPIGRDESLGIFLRVVDAVAYAHQQGVIHRDLKPDNILIVDGVPVVSDFGLGRSIYGASARVTRTVAWIGTRGYSAPEQFGNAREAGPDADVYALGVILNQLLTGTFSEGDAIDFGELPTRYRYVVMKCVQREPADRYPSATELRSDFARLDLDPESAPPPEARAALLATQITDGDAGAIEPFVRLFVEHESEASLYLRALPHLPTTALEPMGAALPGAYARLIRMLCTHTSGQFTISFVDWLSYFLKAAFFATKDEPTHRAILRRLAFLSLENDRDYPARRFAEICERQFDVTRYPELVADILAKEPQLVPAVAANLRALSPLPEIVDHALKARGY